MLWTLDLADCWSWSWRLLDMVVVDLDDLYIQLSETVEVDVGHRRSWSSYSCFLHLLPALAGSGPGQRHWGVPCCYSSVLCLTCRHVACGYVCFCFLFWHLPLSSLWSLTSGYCPLGFLRLLNRRSTANPWRSLAVSYKGYFDIEVTPTMSKQSTMKKKSVVLLTWQCRLTGSCAKSWCVIMKKFCSDWPLAVLLSRTWQDFNFPLQH